jgi:hypothetical protein
VAAVLCKHTSVTATKGCSQDPHRVGEGISQRSLVCSPLLTTSSAGQNDQLQDVRASPQRYLLRESLAEVMVRVRFEIIS